MVVFFICLLFTLLHPRISVILYPNIRQKTLNTFIKTVRNEGSLSTQAFWQFREFYYPGTIKVDRSGLKDNVFYTPPHLLHPRLLLTFKSKYVESNEYIIDNDPVQLQSFFSDKEAYKLVEYPDRYELFFVKPIKDMSITNGFFDYKDKDKELLKNKAWFVATKIFK